MVYHRIAPGDCFGLLIAAELMSYVHSFSVMPHLMRLHALFWIPRSSRGMTNNRTFITPASIRPRHLIRVSNPAFYCRCRGNRRVCQINLACYVPHPSDEIPVCG